MYWFRDAGFVSLLPWLATFLLTWLGGWLLATHAFRLMSRERLIAGLGVGLVGYVWLANLFGRWLNPELTYILPALILLASGAAFAWRGVKKSPWLDREDLSVWPYLIAGLGLFWLFFLWSKGLTLFDEQKNFSLISIMGNGDIPPRFHAAAYPLNFIYHYGFHFIGASLMRLGSMLPWSAFDISKSLLWAEMLLLAFLIGKRYIGQAWGGLAVAAGVALAGGTRFLLLLLPPGLLLQADKLITLQGTSALIGKPLSEALISPWPIDGGPAMPYMFGFLNGIMDPMVMAHQGPDTFSVLILLLVWLLVPRLATPRAWPLLAVLFSVWALVWEVSYALFVLSLIVFVALYLWRMRDLNLPLLKLAILAVMLSVPIVLLQGGTLTELAKDFLFGYEGPGLLGSTGSILNVFFSELHIPSAVDPDFLGFSLRWPPAILSGHLGALSLFSPIEIIVGLFELGPVVLFATWISTWAWRRAKSGDWMLGALAVSGWLGLVLPIFFKYQADRDISRLGWQGLLTWTVLLIMVVADSSFRWHPLLRKAGVASLAVMMFGGLVLAGTQFSAARTTKLGDGFNELDAALAAQVWGKLPADASVFGPLGNTTILTGQLSTQLLGVPRETSTWHSLNLEPALDLLVAEGYDFAYIDSRWWENLPLDIRASSGLDDACVVTLAEVWDNSHVNFRRMLDLRHCSD
jgi:hypothetical protein